MVSSVSYSNAFDAPIHLEPRPSACLAWLFRSAFVGVLLLLTFASVEWWVKLVWAGTLVPGLLLSYRLHVGPGRAIAAVLCEPDGQWRVRLQGEGWQQARLLSEPFVAPALVILRFGVAGRRLPLALVLCPDSAGPAALRRLRVVLRTGAAQPPR